MANADISEKSGAGASTNFAGMYEKHKHLVNYLLIGGTASAIDVLLFLVLFNVVGTSALVAHSIAVPTSVLFSFVVNARHNFKTHDHLALRLTSFIAVCTIGYVVGYAIIVGAASAGLGENLGKFISLPFVFVVQYVLNSKITFRQSK